MNKIIFLVIVCLALSGMGMAVKHKIRNKSQIKAHNKIKAKHHLHSRHKKNLLNNQSPYSMSTILRDWFERNDRIVADREPQSKIEYDPKRYNVLNPLSKEENNKLWPDSSKKYSADSAAYYPNVATPQNVKDDDTLLVNPDMKGLREKEWRDHPFFDNGVHQQDTSEERLPINKADPTPYYNPINEKNIPNDDTNNLFSVPIELKTHHIHEDQLKEQEKQKRMILKKSVYYDASRIYEPPEHDPLKLALEQYEQEKTKKKSFAYKDFLKQESEKKDRIAKVLGKYTEYDPSTGIKRIQNWLKREDIRKKSFRAAKDKLPDKKANDKVAYYDATVNAKVVQ